jgi:hypothetical protein
MNTPARKELQESHHHDRRIELLSPSHSGFCLVLSTMVAAPTASKYKSHTQPASMARSLRGRRWGPMLAILGVLCITLVATSSTLLSFADDGEDAVQALRLHVQPTYRVLDQPTSQGDETATTDGRLTRAEEANTEENITQPGRTAEPTGSAPATTEPLAGFARLRRESTAEKRTQHSSLGPRTRHDRFDTSVSRQRGVIIALHDRIVPLGVSLIKDLRCLGNMELIQVYHCFPDELSSESRELLLRNETRVEIVDVCTHFTEKQLLTTETATEFRNWWVKPLALYHTDLREAIILDADVVALRDPAVLRTLPGYTHTGTTFFYDRVLPWSLYFNANFEGQAGVQLLRRWIEVFDYAAFNLTGPAPSRHLLDSLAYSRLTSHEMDSSMVAIDKSRAGKAMDVLWLLITRTRFELEFSWGDKEAFWLAYEFAHVDYFFSPWGVSVVSSSASRDMEDHPDTLCGSLAHFIPVDDEAPELLYVNGKALIDPYPVGVQESRQANENQLFNVRPTHVTPRQIRKEKAYSETRYFDECLVGMGATPLPAMFHWHLLRRRTFYLGILAGVDSSWSQCTMF